MNVSTVKLFLEVADAGSLSKVASRRQTVQSHISRQIADFEALCGGPLFHRTGRGVVLTELGVRTSARLRAWLHETESLFEEIRADSNQLLGEVRIGIVPSAAHPLMTRLFERLRARHPGIRLSVAEAQGAELDAMLDSGSVDMAILFRYRRPATSEETLLCVAHTYLIAAHGDPLTHEPTIDFAKLAGLQLVLPRRPSQWRQALDETARSLGFKFDLVLEANSLTVQKELVAHTPRLYTVLGPYSVMPELQSGQLRASKLVNPELIRHITLALPRQGKLSPACKEVAQTVQQLVASWGHQLTEPPRSDPGAVAR
jgi:DNA-binding transcriptional LysR family regulator